MKNFVVLTAFTFVLSGCGGGGDSSAPASGAVTGLDMPDSLSVVTADSDGVGKLTFGKSRSKFTTQL